MPFKIFSKGKSKDKKGPASAVVEKTPSVKDDPAVLSPTSSGSAAAAAVYRRPRRALSRPIEVLNEILYRDAGTVMDRIVGGRRPQEVCVVFNPRTYLISWFGGNAKGRIGTHIGQGERVCGDVAMGREGREGKEEGKGAMGGGATKRKGWVFSHQDFCLLSLSFLLLSSVSFPLSFPLLSYSVSPPTPLILLDSFQWIWERSRRCASAPRLPIQR